MTDFTGWGLLWFESKHGSVSSPEEAPFLALLSDLTCVPQLRLIIDFDRRS